MSASCLQPMCAAVHAWSAVLTHWHDAYKRPRFVALPNPHPGRAALPCPARLRSSLQFLDQLLADPSLGKHLSAPSVSLGSTNLYAHGIFEAETRPNLVRPMGQLVPDDGSLLTLNDKKLKGPIRVRLSYKAGAASGRQASAMES